MNVRVGDRDVRMSHELLERLKKTPARHVKSVKERIMKWAEADIAKRPPKPKGHPPPTRPAAPKPGKGLKGQKKSRVARKFIPAHVLFRKQHPIERHPRA